MQKVFTVIAKDSNALAKTIKKNLETHFEHNLIVKDSVQSEALKTVKNEEVGIP